MQFDTLNDELAVLRLVREQIAKDGAWCKGKLQIGDARCAAGWLMHFAHGQTWACNALRTSLDIKHFYSSNMDLAELLVAYNDFPDTTQVDVVDLFDHAIDKLETDETEGVL